MMHGPINIIFIKYYSGEDIKNKKTDGACSTYGEKKGTYMREGFNVEDLSVSGNIILKCILK